MLTRIIRCAIAAVVVVTPMLFNEPTRPAQAELARPQVFAKAPPPGESVVDPRAARCTRFYRGLRNGNFVPYRDDALLTECNDVMGWDAYCDSRNAYPVFTYGPTGRINGQACAPRHDPLEFGEELELLVTGIAEGLADAYAGVAPFVTPVISGIACVKGVLYSCAMLALDIADLAGAGAPAEVSREALGFAHDIATCADGNVVACATVGEKGAKAAGLNIPAADVSRVAVFIEKCSRNDFAACSQVGKSAAQAAGLPTNLPGNLLDASECLRNANGDACMALGKAASKTAGLLGGVPKGADNARKCAEGDSKACLALGHSVASVTSGLTVADEPEPPSFAGASGLNTCVSVPINGVRSELVAPWNNGGQATFAKFTSDGAKFLGWTQWNQRDGGWPSPINWVAADFNGDRKTDIAAIWNNGGENTITMRRSTGSGFIQEHWLARAGGWIPSTVWLPGDFDGDGDMDLAAVWNNNGAVNLSVFPGDKSRFPGWTHWANREGGWMDDAKWLAGDFNGDGKTDIAAIWNNAGQNTITLRLSTGSGFTHEHWLIAAGGWIDSTEWLAGDFDGDGILDLAAPWNNQGATTIAFFKGDKRKFSGWTQWAVRDGGWPDGTKWTASDFNGDGKTDIAAIWNNGGQNTITLRLSTGSGFTHQHWLNDAGGWADDTAWCAGRFN